MRINKSAPKLYYDSMKRYAKYTVILLLVAGIAATCYFIINNRITSRLNAEKEKFAQEVQQKIVLDDLKAEAQPAPDNPTNGTSPTEENAPNIPTKHLLAMPFYSQAPFADWDEIHEDMCEEASLLNGGLYLIGKKPSLADYDQELFKLKTLEERQFGVWKSNPIADIQKLSDAYFEGKIESKIIDNPTARQIETEIAAGHPVIIPLAGRDIGNPNYRQPGPIYHMLVVKGYDEKFFITNDVGTRKGDSYVYRKEVIMRNMFDWNEKDIHLGEKRVLVLYK